MKNISKIIAGIAVGSVLATGCYKEFDPGTYAPAFSVGGYSSTAEIAPANLVAWFPFDGDYVDQVSKNAGTNVGTSFTGGFKGQAMQGALDAYVLFNPGEAIDDMDDFTITYWVNAPATAPPVTGDGIVGLVNLSNTKGFWGNIDMFFENGSTKDAAKFRAHITNGATDSWVSKDGLPGIFGNWANLALSYESATSTFKFYVNGTLSATSTAAGFGPINFTDSGPMVFGTVQFMTDPPLNAGGSTQPWASYLQGQLDEVRIYNKALEAADINALVKLEGRGK